MNRPNYLEPSPMLDLEAPAIQRLIDAQGWRKRDTFARIGAAYDFVRDGILFGYNADDRLPASKVLNDGYGQCNTKTTLLMALLRALEIPCRFHGFTIHKSLQRGVVPELVYPLAPQNIIHSWVEVQYGGRWINLEGFILDKRVLSALQTAFPGCDSLCAYGAGTDKLQDPRIEWRGVDTYIQRTGINQDFGIFATPDGFYARHMQLTGLRGAFYRYVLRHWMNHRVANLRRGFVPEIPGLDKMPAQLEETDNAA